MFAYIDGRIRRAWFRRASVSSLTERLERRLCLSGVSFAPAAEYAAGGAADHVVVADVNADGRLDVVTADYTAGAVDVLLNLGGGGLGAPAPFTTGEGPLSLASGDFNGDGQVDLVTANARGGDATVLLGLGGGRFDDPTHVETGVGPAAVAVGDFDADGRDDLAFAGADDDVVSVVLNDAGAGFATPIPFQMPGHPWSLVAGDFDGDGRTDLASANWLGDDVGVLLSEGGGRFANAARFATGDSPVSIAAADFDRDGRTDLVTADGDGGTVSVLRNDGGGRFTAAARFAAGPDPRFVAAKDFDGDGAPDLVVGSGRGGTGNGAGVMRNLGGFKFAASVTVASGAAAANAAAGDLDGDGRPELVLANAAGGSLFVSLNSTPPLPSTHSALVTAATASEPAAAAIEVASAAVPSSFVLDMVHHNPGEARTQTQFLDPKFLAGWGYNGQVMNDPIQAAVTFDAFDRTTFPSGSSSRQWVLDKAAQIDTQISAAHAAGLKVYYWADFILLPKTLVSKYRSSLVDSNGKIDPHRSLTQQVLRAMLAEIFSRFPGIDGLVVRTGEVYTQDTPYHTGNNPILRGTSSHVTLLNLLRDEVCAKRNKTLVYRTWETSSSGGFHNSSSYYRTVTDAIATHPKLLFSIKHQAGDFQRMTPFNPTISIGKHRQIVEVQAQREYEGKGSSPNYVGKGVIDGWEEYAWINPSGRPDGLREAAASSLFAGVWTWSRGGGWDGPYIKNEMWPKLNAYVIAKWAQDRSRSESSVFNSYATGSLGLGGDGLSRFRELCLLSADAILRGRMSTSGGVNPFWTRDAYIGGTPLLRGFFDSTIDNGRIGTVLAEKADAVSKWKRIESLARQISMPSATTRDYLVTSATYGRIQYEIFREAWTVMIYGRQGDRTGSYNRTAMNQAIANYDARWQEWRNLKASKSNCATLYTDDAFRGDAANGVGAWVDRYRTSGGTTTLQAESAARSGAVTGNGNAGYTGSGYVDFVNASGDWVEWTINNVPSAHTYALTFRYANGGTGDRPLELKVNGAVVRSRLSFPATGSWTAWKTVTLNVTLKAGTNKIRLTAVGSSGGNIDRLDYRLV